MGEIAIESVALVVLATVGSPELIPGFGEPVQPPVVKNAVVTPLIQLVFWPVIWTFALEPCPPLVGVMLVIMAAPGPTPIAYKSPARGCQRDW